MLFLKFLGLDNFFVSRKTHLEVQKLESPKSNQLFIFKNTNVFALERTFNGFSKCCGIFFSRQAGRNQLRFDEKTT